MPGDLGPGQAFPTLVPQGCSQHAHPRAQRQPLAHPNPSSLSLICPPHPTPLGAHLASVPPARLPMCSSLLPCLCYPPEVGAVPLGRPAPPLLSVWSGPQPPAQLSLGQERHVSHVPWEWGAVGTGEGQRNWGRCLWLGAGRESNPVPLVLALPCQLPHAHKGPVRRWQRAMGSGYLCLLQVLCSCAHLCPIPHSWLMFVQEQPQIPPSPQCPKPTLPGP